ncbi:thiolase family protein [Desulfallas sp. Bu1-1]|uniref:thiolase family protein n=1 Tax=Desulfallas sp. Bu1-1 TaxID=2787620 RepID=UPI00189D44DD|nr:thiolase family protein [Desulfallas sp. Bu1-1]MBF7083861.1 thiolase family protein [Desulfallas sp. Bu1-1]
MKEKLLKQKNSDDIVVISATRTPFGRFGGSLKNIDIYDLGAIVMKDALIRINLEPDKIDEVWWGIGDTTNCKDPYTPVVARQSMLKAGIPPERPSCTFDKACVSAMSAVNYGSRSIKLNEAKVVLAGGATSFSTVPYLVRNLRWSGVRLGGLNLEDPIFPLGYKDYAPVAVDSGNLAVEYNVSREEQDDFAYESHLKYGNAYKDGFFKDEMMPLEIKEKDKKGNIISEKVLEIDEQYRPDIAREALAKLKPIFGNPTCTAGNSPGMNDGAAALILTTREHAHELGCEPVCTILTMSTIALQPRIMPVSPAFAIKKCLDKLNLTIDEMDLIEINEAFACVPLISAKLLASKKFTKGNYDEMVRLVSSQPLLDTDDDKYQAIKKKLNVNGGAIAIGHPNTASGARLIMTMAYELKRHGGGMGVCAICGGLTQGDACVIKVE